MWDWKPIKPKCLCPPLWWSSASLKSHQTNEKGAGAKTSQQQMICLWKPTKPSAHYANYTTSRQPAATTTTTTETEVWKHPWQKNLTTNRKQVSPSVCVLWVLRLPPNGPTVLVRLWLTGHCKVSVGVSSRWNDCLSVWWCYQLAIMSSPLWNNQLWKWLTSSLAAALWRGLVMFCAETAAFLCSPESLDSLLVLRTSHIREYF